MLGLWYIGSANMFCGCCQQSKKVNCYAKLSTWYWWLEIFWTP